MIQHSTCQYDEDSYRDIESYRSDVAPLIDGLVVQLDRGPLRINSASLVFQDLVIERFSTSRSFFFEGRHQGDWTGIVLTGDQSVSPGNWNGSELHANSLALLRCGLEYQMRLPGDWDDVQFFLSRDLIERCGLLPESWQRHSDDARRAQLPLTTSEAQRMRARVDSLMESVKSSEAATITARRAAELRETILDDLATTIDDGLDLRATSGLARSARRYDLVRRAIRHIESNLDAPMTAEQLAIDLRVTHWSLQRAFRRVMNLSPYQYLLRRRLNEVHAELRGAHPRPSITDLAAKYYFPSASALAQHYRRLFGELPSATLRRGVH